jgi:hypothetical protein
MGTYGSTWQHRGYCGEGNVASLLDCNVGRPAIVVGSAAGVFEELEVVQRKYGVMEPVVIAANDVGMFLPKLDHWVSLHSDNLANWKNVRWMHHMGFEDAKYHSDMPKPYLDYAWEQLRPLFCLSGYFAMQIAWLMGCSPIILCGCPGSPGPRFFEALPKGVFGYGGGEAGSDSAIRQQVVDEMTRVPEFRKTVRSMSGWTKEFFGGI